MKNYFEPIQSWLTPRLTIMVQGFPMMVTLAILAFPVLVVVLHFQNVRMDKQAAKIESQQRDINACWSAYHDLKNTCKQ